jgi:hypothetical protein
MRSNSERSTSANTRTHRPSAEEKKEKEMVLELADGFDDLFGEV